MSKDDGNCPCYREDEPNCPIHGPLSEAAPTGERELEMVTLNGRSILIHHGLYSVQIVEGDDEDARFVADCAKSLLASYKSAVLQEVRKQVEALHEQRAIDGIDDVLALLDRMEGK